MENPNSKTAQLLLSLTSSIATEIKTEMLNHTDNQFCESVLNELYLGNTYTNPDTENCNIFLNKLFDAVQTCFSLKELKILNDSDTDSGNYYLMYKSLKEYFFKKFKQSKSSPHMFTNLNDDDIYAVIFKEFEAAYTGFAPHITTTLKFIEPELKKRMPDCGKIQDIFKK